MSLHVVYVTMGFPTPYETFAANDVRALRRAGVDVTVFSLRPPHAEASALVRQWRLDGVGISHIWFSNGGFEWIEVHRN